MKLNGLLELGERLPAFRELADSLATAGASVPAKPLGVHHAARPYLAAMLARALDRPLVVVTARSGRARQWVDDLRVWLPDEYPVHFFADPDALPYERIPWAPETRQRRLEGLVSLLTIADRGSRIEASPEGNPKSAIRNPQSPIVVASARALIQVTLPMREMRGALRPIR